MAALLREKRDEILELSAKYGAHHVRIFGSFARGDERTDSDIDFLLEFEPTRSLLDHAGLTIELQQLLGRKVDIGTPSGLRAKYRDRILSEVVDL